jgi:hypothetical protein
MKSREGRSRMKRRLVREERRGTVSGGQVAVTTDKKFRHILALIARGCAR